MLSDHELCEFVLNLAARHRDTNFGETCAVRLLNELVEAALRAALKPEGRNFYLFVLCRQSH